MFRYYVYIETFNFVVPVVVYAENGKMDYHIQLNTLILKNYLEVILILLLFHRPIQTDYTAATVYQVPGSCLQTKLQETLNPSI